MRFLFIDIDTLRYDHLGCYGYERNTSPNIDAIAKDSVRLNDYYCSDAPCLPSRAALFTGRFGINTGVVGHGGTAADMALEGPDRDFVDRNADQNLPAIMRRYGLYPVSISSFAERHGAWWFQAGFKEMYNVGNRGHEVADEVTPTVLDWLERNKDREDWFLHVHYWDPHTMYRAPESFGNPFEGQNSSSLDWITEDVFAKHRQMVGCHCASEVNGYSDNEFVGFPRQLSHFDNLDDVRFNLDGYDCGIAYADYHVGKIVDKLKEQGIYDDMIILVSSDHGEDMGELGRYDEHGCADECVTHIPFILKWPGLQGNVALDGLHYNVDFLPTLIEMMDDLLISSDGKLPYQKNAKEEKSIYDGESFAASLKNQTNEGRDYLVLSQCAHVCQRSVRFEDYLYIRTYHDGYCLFDDDQLYNIKADPHEQNNLAASEKEKCYQAAYYMEQWHTEQMKKKAKSAFREDPLWTVMAEGGPFHAKGYLEGYLKRLEGTDRADKARQLREKYPEE